MNSIRARILLPVLFLVLLADVLISWAVLRYSHHEIEEIYDAQLAQSARLLQGVLAQRASGDNEPAPVLSPQVALLPQLPPSDRVG